MVMGTNGSNSIRIRWSSDLSWWCLLMRRGNVAVSARGGENYAFGNMPDRKVIWPWLWVHTCLTRSICNDCAICCDDYIHLDMTKWCQGFARNGECGGRSTDRTAIWVYITDLGRVVNHDSKWRSTSNTQTAEVKSVRCVTRPRYDFHV